MSAAAVQALQDDLQAGLGPRVRVAAAALDREPPLLPEERGLVSARAVESRRREIAVGRHLARRLLSELGAPPRPLLRNPDRTPRWPAGFVGSITHTKDVCVVAAARAGAVRSVGLDVEGHVVSESLFDRLLGPEELERLAGLDADAAARHVTLCFSAKEAFYKAQYPLTETFLGFHDVFLEIEEARRRLSCRVTAADPKVRGLALEGFFVRTDRWVATAFLAE